MTRKPAAIVIVTAIGLLALLLVPATFAAKGGGGAHGGGGGGKPGGGSCTQKAPGVVVDNNWAWGAPGSYGVAGQQLTYAIDVINYDAGCGTSSFVVTVSAPSGFAVSMSTSTISLGSASQGYVWANVTSPDSATNGDYPLTVTVERSGAPSSSGTYTSYYKVYSSDGVVPTLYWPSPADGTTISGRSYNVAVSANDDHRLRTIDLSIDGVAKSTSTCDGVSYSCQLNYTWSPTVGSHSATYKATDWLGNVAVLTTTFNVS